ncbi:MAG: hypothetical protein LQ344_006060 [Seirophora lacunosa]|nr:MAG: hypothetical protein LQ344_006060 [Seirophora lacunosa]
MLLTSIHLLTLTSFALASPLKFRRQDAVTITSTVTVPASSATTTSSTTSIVPLIPTVLPAPGSDPSTNPPLVPCKEVCNEEGTSCPVVCPIQPPTASPSPLAPLIPTTPPNTTPTSSAPVTCEQYCSSNNIAYDTCIAGCTIVDGQPQANAPPLVVTPPGEETSSTSRVARATEDTPAAPTCEEYCRSNNIAYDACISYCQIVDGQPQLNAPPLIVTPPTTKEKTSPSTPAASPAATLDQLLHACQASCVPGSSNFGNCRETCETLKGFAEKGIAGSSSEGK